MSNIHPLLNHGREPELRRNGHLLGENTTGHRWEEPAAGRAYSYPKSHGRSASVHGVAPLGLLAVMMMTVMMTVSVPPMIVFAFGMHNM